MALDQQMSTGLPWSHLGLLRAYSLELWVPPLADAITRQASPAHRRIRELQEVASADRS